MKQQWNDIYVGQLAVAQRKLGISSGVKAIQGSGSYIVSTGTVQFQNSNGVTFGLSGSVMTASVMAGPAAGIGGISAGTELATSGTVLFQNSNGITLGCRTTA